MHLAHHPIFVALSVLTAWVGAWTALDLFRRVQAHTGSTRIGWVAAAGLAMGLSIWSMHFIAMLGFNPGSEVRYDVKLTVLSLLLAIAATTFAFVWARPNRVRQVGSGLVMGAGIWGMHYVGMAAVITGATLSNEPAYVVLAFFVAVAASAGGLRVAMGETTIAQRILAALVLGFAIVGMHYTAMLGVHISADPSSQLRAIGIDPFVLAIGVAAGTLFILMLALIAALSDRRFEAIAVREALHSEKQLRAILDNLPIGIFVAASPSGQIRFANAEATSLLGHALGGAALWAHEGRHGLVDKNGQRLPAEAHVLHEAMHDNRRVGPRVQTYRRADGRVIQLEVTAAPIPDRENNGTLSVAAFQDVTAKLLAEERVRAALAEKADAEAALMHAQRLESLGRLTGGVAHDFNNLLTVVIGALDVILRDPDNAARRIRLAEAALASARRGERLTAQLLAFARRQPLQLQRCDLNELIRECEPLLRRAAGESISLTLRLSADEAVALIDRTQFEASLLNLLVNAVHASAPDGEIDVETQVVLPAVDAGPNVSRQPSVRVSVTDRGQGMSPEIVDQIFEPFFTTKDPGKGTGLGLSQVYGFVKQSGGEVQVQSTPGKGTCMSVLLPLQAADGEIASQTSANAHSFVRPLRILLAEDDASVAGITQAMLTQLGHNVTCTANAEQALQVLRSDCPIDVLLTDVLMPGGMNGVELAREAVKVRPELPILLCSGYAGESLDEAIARSEWSLLRKPFLQDELAEALATLVRESPATPSVVSVS